MIVATLRGDAQELVDFSASIARSKRVKIEYKGPIRRLTKYEARGKNKPGWSKQTIHITLREGKG